MIANKFSVYWDTFPSNIHTLSTKKIGLNSEVYAKMFKSRCKCLYISFSYEAISKVIELNLVSNCLQMSPLQEYI